MDCETEDPPTSIISPVESNFSQVVFINVPQFYQPKTDVKCSFRREESFDGSAKDWIGIFKVGWKNTREYYTWISARTSVDNTLLFTAYYLPKDDDYYQFCYVDHNGQVRGASIPFQFRHNIPNDEDDILLVTTETEIMKTNEENAELKKVVKTLTEETAVLKEKVSSLQNEKQAQAGRIQSLQDDLLSSTEKTERLETDNLEMTVQKKNLEDELERMNKIRQSLVCDLHVQRSQEEKLLSEIKTMDGSKGKMQEEKKQFEEQLIHIKTLEEENKKLESEMKQYREKEQTFFSDREELNKSLEKLVAENQSFQSEDKAKQTLIDNLTCNVNQCKEENVKLKAELEFQKCTLEREKKQNETLKQSLDIESKRARDLERSMEQKNQKLRSAEETTSSLNRQVDELKNENNNQMKQMGILHITIANLEGEVKRMKDGCKSKMETERTLKELRTNIKSTEEKVHNTELQLAQQKDLNRQQGEEMFTLRNALELREEEIQDLKEMHEKNRNEIVDLHGQLLGRASTGSMTPDQSLLFGNPYGVNYPSFPRESGSSTNPASRRPSNPLVCPVCDEVFMPEEQQILEDHVLCHLDGDEARS